MIEHANGQEQLPTIKVMMHPTKGVHLAFETTEFADFIYLIGVLNMAVKKAENMWEQSQLQAIQKQALERQLVGKQLRA